MVKFACGKLLWNFSSNFHYLKYLHQDRENIQDGLNLRMQNEFSENQQFLCNEDKIKISTMTFPMFSLVSQVLLLLSHSETCARIKETHKTERFSGG